MRCCSRRRRASATFSSPTFSKEDASLSVRVRPATRPKPHLRLDEAAPTDESASSDASSGVARKLSASMRFSEIDVT